MEINVNEHKSYFRHHRIHLLLMSYLFIYTANGNYSDKYMAHKLPKSDDYIQLKRNPFN